MATPTLIGMPEPPSNPDTPIEAPGTPNSTTTSLSALSTTAIKDGHRGSAFPHTGHGHRHTPSSNEAERERADRISFLAGLERVSTARPANQTHVGGAPGAGLSAGQIPGYFDQNGNPVYTTKMSTVGSASATGSAGGHTTTWASTSQKCAGDEDQMSVDANYRDVDDRDRFSASAMDEDVDGMSDDASLVGFGEGAGSTVSGPIYSRRDPAASPAVTRSGLGNHNQSIAGGIPGTVVTSATAEQGHFDTQRLPSRGAGTVEAEKLLRDRLDDGKAKRPLGSPDEGGLGKFYFEDKK
ncbi:hypothetical protein PZA11_005148 [Diplocarpon coronariae]|uniref:Uncharacterized protein n=1 Tax=Diplocarpon coronariae TaxID=2795749 RepID=A0A218Z8U8_9HELO|nr:hypothetical protein JHW43_008467 [Diplocarpon mali]OWP04487.1 hypothetical protein B2J93_1346 [Marssonina coronariae]